MEELIGTFIDKNGKTKTMDMLKDPVFQNIIKFGGEIVIPKDRADIYEFVKQLQKINPNIQIKRSINVKGSYTCDAMRKKAEYRKLIHKFKTRLMPQAILLQNALMQKKSKLNEYGIFNIYYELSADDIKYYDIIIDLMIKNILDDIIRKRKGAFVLKKLDEEFFNNCPPVKEIGQQLMIELLFLYDHNDLSSVNTLDYVFRRIPTNYSYKKTQDIIWEAIKYMLDQSSVIEGVKNESL